MLLGTTGLETTILEPGVIGHLTPGHYVSVSALTGPPTPARRADRRGVPRRRHQRERRPGRTPRAVGKGVAAHPHGDDHVRLPLPDWSIRDLPETAALIETLLDEVTAVARAYGFDLPEARERARGWIFDRAPSTMKASMARDFERGTRTELEALTGALVRMADARGLDVPASRAAYAILKLREQPDVGT